MCNYKDRYLFVSGGFKFPDWYDCVDMFDIENDEWNLAPNLNKKRAAHSSCSLENSIFVFCGATQAYMMSIEMLDAEGFINGEPVEWQLVQLNEGSLSPRENPLVASLSDTELLILGGFDGRRYLNDGYILETNEMILDKVIDAS